MEKTPDELYEVFQQHFAWLHQFAWCDDEWQSRNYLDNMLYIRRQVEGMKEDLDLLMQHARKSK
jgi:hypothetical protein